MTGAELTKLVFKTARLAFGAAKDIVFKEIDDWAEKNRVDQSMRTKLGLLKSSAGTRLEELERDYSNAIDEGFRERDDEIAELKRTIEVMKRNDPETAQLRRSILELVDFSKYTRRAVQQTQDETPPNGESYQLHAVPIPPDLTEFPRERVYRGPIEDLMRMHYRYQQGRVYRHDALGGWLMEHTTTHKIMIDVLQKLANERGLTMTLPSGFD